MVLKNDEIVECYYIAGDFDFMVKVITESRKGLEGVLNYIKGIDGVSLTRTIVVLSIIKNEVSLLPETDNLK